MHHDAETSYNQFISWYVCLCVRVMVRFNTIILQYSNAYKEYITMTYIINGRGTVLRFTDRSLSLYADLFKL